MDSMQHMLRSRKSGKMGNAAQVLMGSHKGNKDMAANKLMGTSRHKAGGLCKGGMAEGGEMQSQEGSGDQDNDGSSKETLKKGGKPKVQRKSFGGLMDTIKNYAGQGASALGNIGGLTASSFGKLGGQAASALGNVGSQLASTTPGRLLNSAIPDSVKNVASNAANAAGNLGGAGVNYARQQLGMSKGGKTSKKHHFDEGGVPAMAPNEVPAVAPNGMRPIAPNGHFMYNTPSGSRAIKNGLLGSTRQAMSRGGKMPKTMKLQKCKYADGGEMTPAPTSGAPANGPDQKSSTYKKGGRTMGMRDGKATKGAGKASKCLLFN